MRKKITKFIMISLVAGFFAMAGASLSHSAGNDFSLIWTADSYVPANYQGKAMPSRGSHVKVVAAPVTKTATDPSKFFYRWLFDGNVATRNSGIGKMDFTFLATKWAGDTYRVELQILDPLDLNSILARYITEIPAVDAEAYIFTANSLLPIKDVLSTKTNQEIKLTAIPLFFATPTISGINFTWEFDNKKISDNSQKNPNVLTIKIPTASLASSFTKNLRLFAAQKSDPLQQVSIDLNLEIK